MDMAYASDPDERSLLLPPSDAPVHTEEKFNLRRELISLLKRAAPIFATFALQNLVQALSVVIAGRLGALALAATSYGYMFFTVTGTLVAIGGATALDTRAAQAFTAAAAEDRQVLGLLLQQSVLVLLTLFACITCPIWAFSADIFRMLGQEEELAVATGRFLLSLIPAAVVQIIAENLKKFLQVQGEGLNVTWVTLAASLTAIPINVVLVGWTDLGILGGAISFGTYQMLMVVSLISTILKTPSVRASWRSTLTGVLEGMSSMVLLAVTGICSIAIEWWYFEITALMAARLDSVSVATQSVSNNGVIDFFD
jgi:multidrug resistance protein, MATE family